MRPRLTHEGAKRRAERERRTGLDPEDEAARWLEEHDPPLACGVVVLAVSELHRWRRKQQHGGG